MQLARFSAFVKRGEEARRAHANKLILEWQGQHFVSACTSENVNWTPTNLVACAIVQKIGGSKNEVVFLKKTS